MKLSELLLESSILELVYALMEAQTPEAEQNNNIVKSWAKKLDMSYDELHEVWEKAKVAAKNPNAFGLIVSIFKRMVTSMKGTTKKQLQDGGKATFNYKVRTQQSKEQLLDDKPAPKNTNRDFVKSTKLKINKLNTQLKELKTQNENDKSKGVLFRKRQEKIKELQSKKKELLNSLK